MTAHQLPWSRLQTEQPGQTVLSRARNDHAEVCDSADAIGPSAAAELAPQREAVSGSEAESDTRIAPPRAAVPDATADAPLQADAPRSRIADATAAASANSNAESVGSAAAAATATEAGIGAKRVRSMPAVTGKAATPPTWGQERVVAQGEDVTRTANASVAGMPPAASSTGRSAPAVSPSTPQRRAAPQSTPKGVENPAKAAFVPTSRSRTPATTATVPSAEAVPAAPALAAEPTKRSRSKAAGGGCSP